MREIRLSGSEGGGTGNSTGPPYPYPTSPAGAVGAGPARDGGTRHRRPQRVNRAAGEADKGVDIHRRLMRHPAQQPKKRQYLPVSGGESVHQGDRFRGHGPPPGWARG